MTRFPLLRRYRNQVFGSLVVSKSMRSESGIVPHLLLQPKWWHPSCNAKTSVHGETREHTQLIVCGVRWLPHPMRRVQSSWATSSSGVIGLNSPSAWQVCDWFIGWSIKLLPLKIFLIPPAFKVLLSKLTSNIYSFSFSIPKPLKSVIMTGAPPEGVCWFPTEALKCGKFDATDSKQFYIHILLEVCTNSYVDEVFLAPHIDYEDFDRLGKIVLRRPLRKQYARYRYMNAWLAALVWTQNGNTPLGVMRISAISLIRVERQWLQWFRSLFPHPMSSFYG